MRISKEQRAPVRDLVSPRALLSEQRAPVRDLVSPRALLREQRAQSEVVFRLMIDSIVGLAILVIIISAVSYFNDQAITQSKADFVRTVQYASSSPDGQVITSKDLTFARGFGVDSSDLQNWTGYAAKCFSFRSILSSVQVTNDSKRVEFNQNIGLKVFSKCVSFSSCDPADKENSCCICCIISFGKATTEEPSC